MSRSRDPRIEKFRFALMRLRQKMGWTQADFGKQVGVSKRLVSLWENAHAVPSMKTQHHLVVALADASPKHVLDLVEALGLHADPVLEPLLRPHYELVEALRRAEEGPDEPPPPPKATPEQLRAAVDAVVWKGADEANVPANDLRAAVARVLATGEELGATLAELREAVAVRTKGRRV